MEESRWQKHITWDDPDEIEARYKELSSKFDKGINPFNFSDVKSLQLKPSDLSQLESESSSIRPPSRFLQQKHEKIVTDMKDVQSTSSELHWGEIITNHSVQSFLKQYFPRSSKIPTAEFLGFLEFEYPNLMNSLEMREKLSSLLCVDKKNKYISINALEISTRDQTLEDLLESISQELEDNFKESKAEIHEQIIKELTEAQAILESRKSDLDRRESVMSTRETRLLKLETKTMTEFKEKLEKMAALAKDKIMKDINLQLKRLQGLERNVNDMLKLARTKQQSLTRSELSIKSSVNENSSKLKARISSLEKSNEVLKTKLSIFELESKTDKSTILKLSEELSRLKARSSMLEQSLNNSNKKPEPEKVEMIKEEPEKKPVIVYDPGMFIALLAVIVKCCKITLPVIHAPASPKSVSHRVSVLEEDLSVGEVFFPAFNKLVPPLIESLPFVHKHKNKEDQQEILQFLWNLLVYAWSEDVPRNDSQFNPNNLPFEATTAIWKQKLGSLQKKPSRKPIFPLFSNLSVHRTASFYLVKWLNNKSNRKSSLTSAFLLVLLTVSQKKLVKALHFVKDHFSQDCTEDLDRFIQVLVYLLDSPDETSGLACEILLGLTVEHLPQVVIQCSNDLLVFKIAESCKKALMDGQKLGSVSDTEESLIVFLQKLSSNDLLLNMFKNQGLVEILASRALSAGNNSFFKNNLNSIIRNLSN